MSITVKRKCDADLQLSLTPTLQTAQSIQDEAANVHKAALALLSLTDSRNTSSAEPLAKRTKPVATPPVRPSLAITPKAALGSTPETNKENPSAKDLKAPKAAVTPSLPKLHDRSTEEELSAAIIMIAKRLRNNEQLDLSQQKSFLTHYSQTVLKDPRYLNAGKDYEIAAGLIYLSHYKDALPSSIVIIAFEAFFTNLKQSSNNVSPNAKTRITEILNMLLDCLRVLCERRGNVSLSDVETIITSRFTYSFIGHAKSFIVASVLSIPKNLLKSEPYFLVSIFKAIKPKDLPEKGSVIQALFLLTKNEHIAKSAFDQTLVEHLQKHYFQEKYPPELHPSIQYLQSIRPPLRVLNNPPK